MHDMECLLYQWHYMLASPLILAYIFRLRRQHLHWPQLNDDPPNLQKIRLSDLYICQN